MVTEPPPPLPADEVIGGIDAVSALPPSLPLFCQPEDADVLSRRGFTDVRPVEDRGAGFDGIAIIRKPAPRPGQAETALTLHFCV